MRIKTPQYRFLSERLESARSAAQWWRIDKKDKHEPIEVRRARAVIRKHENALHAKRKRYERRIDTLHQKAKEALLFKDDKVALAAVEKFEKAIAKLKV